jgi:ADP-ribose pyrophosphatase
VSDTREIAWQGKWITAIRDGKWEYVTRNRGIGAVVIIAIEDGQVLLVEQYRVPIGMRCIELPAGLVGDDHEGEDPLDSAKRELEEETGYTCKRVEHLGGFGGPGRFRRRQAHRGRGGRCEIADAAGAEPAGQLTIAVLLRKQEPRVTACAGWDTRLLLSQEYRNYRKLSAYACSFNFRSGAGTT